MEKLMEKEGFKLTYWSWSKDKEEYYIYHRGCGDFPWESKTVRAKVCHCGREIPKELLFIAEMLGWDHKYLERRKKSLSF